MRSAPNGGHQHPIWLLPLLTCCQPCLGLFILAWSISAGSMFGEPLRPKIEIITTGWEKRKSENVSERAYAPSGAPHPSAPASASLSIHPCYTVSSLFCCLQTEVAGRQAGWGGVESRLLCVVWIGWQPASEFRRNGVIKSSGVVILSLMSLCFSSGPIDTNVPD